MVTDKGTVESERRDQVKRGEIPLDVHIGEKKNVKGNMESERATIHSSPAVTGVGVPKHPRLSCRSIQRTTVGDCRHVDASLEQGGSIFFQVVVGVKPDKQTS